MPSPITATIPPASAFQCGRRRSWSLNDLRPVSVVIVLLYRVFFRASAGPSPKHENGGGRPWSSTIKWPRADAVYRLPRPIQIGLVISQAIYVACQIVAVANRQVAIVIVDS